MKFAKIMILAGCLALFSTGQNAYASENCWNVEDLLDAVAEAEQAYQFWEGSERLWQWESIQATYSLCDAERISDPNSCWEKYWEEMYKLDEKSDELKAALNTAIDAYLNYRYPEECSGFA